MDVIVMPQLGETVVEGTLVAWAKAVGDEVAVDDTLFEVSTEKVDTEVPSAVAGYLRAVLVPEGDVVPIGTPVAVITATADEPFEPPAVDAPPAGQPTDTIGIQAGLGEPAPDPAEVAPRLDLVDRDLGAPPQRNEPEPGRPPAQVRPLGEEGDDGVRSPVVRRLLAEKGLRAADVAGSGRDRRITRADVLAVAAQQSRTGAPPDRTTADHLAPPLAVRPDPGPDDEVVALSRARLATAGHMVHSRATAAHALVVVAVDYAAVDAVRRAAGLSYLPFVARAVVDALADFPHLNATFDVDRLLVHRRVNLGIAVDVDREALLVPVVNDAQDLRLPALAAAVTDLADRARRRRLSGDAFDGGTFTLTNVGAFGTVVTAPIINQPQVAICSTDGVRMTPVAVRTDDGAPGGQPAWGIAVRPVGNLCLSFDHRAVDGAYAAEFLAAVRDHLEQRDWSAEVQR